VKGEATYTERAFLTDVIEQPDEEDFPPYRHGIRWQ
jgi:hypothetical protein